MESARITSTVYAPTGVFSPNLQINSENLTAEQAPDMYNLVVEFQALDTKLANEFQTLSGLEAIHHAVAQATTHEIINAGCTAQSEAYGLLPRDQDHKPKHKETPQQLLTEADKVWKDTNDVMYSHQLQYDRELTAFISNAEATLQEKQSEIWRCIHSLMDVAGLPHDSCLDLTLKILNQLPTIPLDLLYCTPLLMMTAYAPESYI